MPVKQKINYTKMKSFVDIPVDSDFPLENLPYGIFSTKENVSCFYLFIFIDQETMWVFLLLTELSYTD